MWSPRMPHFGPKLFLTHGGIPRIVSRVWPLLLAASLLSAAPPPVGAMGEIERIEAIDRGVLLRATGGALRIEFVTESIVRLTASRTDAFPADTTHAEANGPYYIESYSRAPRPPTVQRTATGWEVGISGGGANCHVEVQAAPFRLRVMRGTDPVVEMSGRDAIEFGKGRTLGRLTIHEREHFIGFGAHRHPLDMRGRSIVLTTSELGKEGEGGGFPVPWVMSSRGYGLFLNNVDPTTRFDVGESDAGRLTIDAGDGGRESWNFDLHVVVGRSFADLMAGYTTLTGRPLLAEKWFFGNMQSKCCDWRAEDVLYIANRFRELQLPLDAMILDLQWREVRSDMWEWTPAFDETESKGPRKNLRWSPSFGDAGHMFRGLDELGVKVGLHENTMSTYSDDAQGAGAYLDQAFPDLSKPEVANRLWEMHRPLVAQGADFWWQDQGERIRGQGANGYPITNLNGALWAKLVVEGMRREFQQSVPVLSRSGPVGGHRYISPWPGDVPAGLSFAKLDLDYIRNGGLAGYATIGADMGGFYRGHTPDEENEIRRICDMLLVFPVARTHGAYYKLPWMFAHEAQLTYARYLQLRYRLLPYIYSAAIEAHETGRPILAPLCFDHGDDEETYRRDFDFLLGRDLLVAPVVESADQREVYLPRGKWRNFWTDELHAGGKTVTVSAPLAGGRSLPMLVRVGAILPMTASRLNVAAGLFDRYTFHAYPEPGAGSRRTFKDRARALDESSVITAALTDTDHATTLVIEGTNATEAIYFHGVDRPSEVVVNGARLPEKSADGVEAGWRFGAGDFDAQGAPKVLMVRLPRATGKTIECQIRK